MALVRRGIVRLLLFIGGYVLFLLLGATVFSAIEGPKEFQMVQDLKSTRSRFLEEHKKCVTGKFLFLDLLLIDDIYFSMNIYFVKQVCKL